jgi:hypothetical protein
MTFEIGDAHMKFDADSKTIFFGGSMRLANMKEYDKVSDFMKQHSEGISDRLQLDFKELQFLNSSGITTLSMFILGLKKKASMNLTIVGSEEVSWQQKSLSNFKKLWPEIELIIN